MENERRFPGGLTRGERIGGWIFLVLYLFQGINLLLSLFVLKVLRPGSEAEGNLLLNLLFDGVSLLILIPLLRRYLLGQLRILAANVGKTLRYVVLGALLMLLCVYAEGVAISFVGELQPEYSNENQALLSELMTFNPVLFGVMACVTAPLVEELLFRGVVFGSLRPRSRLLAYLLSALCFGLAHVIGSVFSVSLFVTAVNLGLYALLGLVLAWVCDRSECLFASIFLHMLYNTAVYLIQLQAAG